MTLVGPDNSLLVRLCPAVPEASLRAADCSRGRLCSARLPGLRDFRGNFYGVLRSGATGLGVFASGVGLLVGIRSRPAATGR